MTNLYFNDQYFQIGNMQNIKILSTENMINKHGTVNGTVNG